jgi:hypothetical protein
MTPTCPRCHRELSAEVAEGLCPECLFRQALAGPGTGPYQDEANRSPAPVFVPPAPAELTPFFPQLEMLRLVGQGGMGAVYLARQPELDRLVAVKILPPEVARDPGFTERFSREARSLARLNHPNIVTIFDFGTTNGLYYFTMEYVDGKNVRELLASREVAPSLALQIISQVCDALQFAHDEGFVHRDIKPENILLDKKGRVKIADFGLARLVGFTPAYQSLTGSREVMGTLYYMAPEQIKRAHAVDHRADLYSLGVVFYEMLTGELPVGRFATPSQGAGVDARLDAIVLRALAREPENRYQDASQIKREVEVALAGGPSPPAAPAAPPRPRPILPCVRFAIPDVSWTGAMVKGEIYGDFRDEPALVLEFRVLNWLGLYEAPQMIRIPRAEIVAIACQGKTEIILKVAHAGVLADLPAGNHGRGRLQVHRADREAAQQLVDGFLQGPKEFFLPPEPDRIRKQVPAPGIVDVGPVGRPSTDLDRVRKQLVGPALGLLLTAAGVAVSTVVLAVLLVSKVFHGGDDVFSVLLLVAGGVVLPAGVGLLGLGALRMMEARRSYLLCLTAALVAILPWSPAWVIGLPSGIWALLVLSRPEVLAAFFDKRRAEPLGPPGDLKPPAPQGGKLRALWRSVAGYFLTTSTGTRARERDANS